MISKIDHDLYNEEMIMHHNKYPPEYNKLV